MSWIEWLAIITIGSTVYIYVAYMALCTAIKMQEAARSYGFELPFEMRAVCLVLYVFGVPADWIYNWTIGNVRFRFKTPWKITYSSRIQWHIDNLHRSNRPLTAFKWAIMLNAGQAGHIKRVPAVSP